MVDPAAGTSHRLLSASLGRVGIRLSANGRLGTVTESDCLIKTMYRVAGFKVTN